MSENLVEKTNIKYSQHYSCNIIKLSQHCRECILYIVCEHQNPFKFSDNLSTTQGHYQEVQTVIETDPMPLNVGDFLTLRLLEDVL